MKYLFVIAVILLVAYFISPIDETNDIWKDAHLLHSEIKQLVVESDFTELERLVQEARKEKYRYKTSEWVLHDIYNSIPYSLSNFENIYEFLYAWKNANPETNVPDIIESRAFLARAWQIRGNAKLRDLSESEHSGFKEYLGKSWDSISIAEKKGPIDPEICTVKTKLAYLLYADKKKARRYFDDCVELEPGYHEVYIEMINYLQPKWFGSAEEMLRFTQESADATSYIDGDGLYALLVNVRAFNSNKLFTENGGEFSWERTRNGFRDIINKYGDSSHILHTYGYLAMIAGDHQAFAEILAKTGTEWGELKEKYYKNKSWYEYHMNQSKKYF